MAWDQRPDRRTRRAFLHLSYSCVSPCGPAILVTQCHKRKWRDLFSHLIGAGEQRRWDRKAEALGCLEVDGQFELGRKLCVATRFISSVELATPVPWAHRLFRVREIWIGYTLCRPARRGAGARDHPQVAAFVIGGVAKDLHANRKMRIVGLSPPRPGRPDRPDRKIRQSQNAHQNLLRDMIR